MSLELGAVPKPCPNTLGDWGLRGVGLGGGIQRMTERYTTAHKYLNIRNVPGSTCTMICTQLLRNSEAGGALDGSDSRFTAISCWRPAVG